MSPVSADPRRLTCARCGAAFECGSTMGHCWCAEEDFRLPVPIADSAQDCLCRQCLKRLAESAARNPPLERGRVGVGVLEELIPTRRASRIDLPFSKEGKARVATRPQTRAGSAR